MKVLGLLCAVVSLITGLAAAWYWFKASKVGIDPGWKVEPGDAERHIMGWVTGCMIAFTSSGKLNKVAALLTGISIGFGGISTFLMAFAQGV